MPLRDYLYHALWSFRTCFSRRRTWITFCLAVVAAMGASEFAGVTSLCGFVGWDEAGYHRLLHLFRSTAWRMDALIEVWVTFVQSQDVLVQVGGRAVLVGDHCLAVKDGVRMPGVVTLHQHSETQSKPSYFRGHCWGVLGVLIGTRTQALFCLPLVATIQQGFAHLRQDATGDSDKSTLTTRLVRQAVDLAVRHQLPCILVLDAYFSVASVFAVVDSVWSIQIRQALVTVLTRAKCSYVAYHPAIEPEVRGPGRPPKYGTKVKLYNVFTEHPDAFREVSCEVYGRVESVRVLAMNLLWKPTKGMIRFVFAETSRGPIVLMSNDLTLDPITALSLYCARVRIETTLSVLKGVLAAFAYRFWSKSLPRHSRRPKRNQTLKPPSPKRLAAVTSAWEACERYVVIHCIATGLLQLLALRYQHSIWARFGGFLRTRSRQIPSERTVRRVLAHHLHDISADLASGAAFEKIHRPFPEAAGTPPPETRKAPS